MTILYRSLYLVTQLFLGVLCIRVFFLTKIPPKSGKSGEFHRKKNSTVKEENVCFADVNVSAVFILSRSGGGADHTPSSSTVLAPVWGVSRQGIKHSHFSLCD
jgi:hypothetical protein